MLSTSPPKNSETSCFLESIYTSYFQFFSHLPALLHQPITIIVLSYHRITGQLYEYNEKCVKLTTGQKIEFDSIRFVLCRPLRLRFILDNYPQICARELGQYPTTLQSTARMGISSFGEYQQEEAFVKDNALTTTHPWKHLPREIIFECMRFSRDLPDILVWRLVSRSFSEHLKKSLKSIECFNMKSVGGKSWRLEKRRTGCGMDRLITYFDANQIKSIVLPRENYISKHELQTIATYCTSLRKITFQFATRMMDHLFSEGTEAPSVTLPAWSTSVQEVEFIALFLNKRCLSVPILNTLQDRFPALKQITLDFCKYEPRHLRTLRGRLKKDTQLVLRPHSKALSRFTSLEIVEYALDVLQIDPNMPFEEIYSGMSRATSLLDTAVTRSANAKRQQILEYFVQRGASIRDSISRMGWWHIFTHPIDQRKRQTDDILHLCAKYQDSRLFQPCMFRSLTRLEGIDVMTEETLARIFEDFIPSRFFREQEFLFEAVTFTSPHYRHLFEIILRENMHQNTNTFFSNQTAHRYDTLLSLAICNTAFITEEDISYMMSFPFDVATVLDEGNTYLHLATAHQRLDLARRFLEEFHADINKGNLYGETPLHLACQLEDLSFAAQLVHQYGADILLRDNRGQTPHEVALCTRNRFQSEVSKAIPSELVHFPSRTGEVEQASFYQRQFPRSTSGGGTDGGARIHHEHREPSASVPRTHFSSSLAEPASKRMRYEDKRG